MRPPPSDGDGTKGSQRGTFRRSQMCATMLVKICFWAGIPLAASAILYLSCQNRTGRRSRAHHSILGNNSSMIRTGISRNFHFSNNCQHSTITRKMHNRPKTPLPETQGAFFSLVDKKHKSQTRGQHFIPAMPGPHLWYTQDPPWNLGGWVGGAKT